MASAMTDLRLPSQLQSVIAHWPVPNNIAAYYEYIVCNKESAIKDKGRILVQRSLRDHRTSALYSLGSGSWSARANGAAAQTAAIQLHALTYNWTRIIQLANTQRSNRTHQAFNP